jgi:hypothetical protein
MTPVWVGRSLAMIAIGAVLALAVTVHNRTFDIQTAGAVLVWVGLFDLVLNAGLLMYQRHLNDRGDYR